MPSRHHNGEVFADLTAREQRLLECICRGMSNKQIARSMQIEIATIRSLGNGFIITSLLWASTLAAMIDREFRKAAICMTIAAGLSLFGIMHSPFPGAAMFFVLNLDPASQQTPLSYVVGYLLVAAMMIGWDAWLRKTGFEFPLKELEH
jgi:hypothetical protein